MKSVQKLGTYINKRNMSNTIETRYNTRRRFVIFVNRAHLCKHFVFCLMKNETERIKKMNITSAVKLSTALHEFSAAE